MKKLLMSMIVMGLTMPAMAQTSTTYSNAAGQVTGYSSTVGNQTTYSDSSGRVIGYENQVGIQTTYSNSMGQVTGYSTNLGTPQPVFGPNEMPNFGPNPLTGR
jgi:hypothetical protein